MQNFELQPEIGRLLPKIAIQFFRDIISDCDARKPQGWTTLKGVKAMQFSPQQLNSRRIIANSTRTESLRIQDASLRQIAMTHRYLLFSAASALLCFISDSKPMIDHIR